jgi:hypothetical protein
MNDRLETFLNRSVNQRSGGGLLQSRRKSLENSGLAVRLVLQAFTDIGDQTSNQADHDAAWQNSTHPLIRS